MRVVVADDDPFTLSLIKAGLEGQQFEVTAVKTVGGALAAVRATEPHALISDLDFDAPVSGAELLAQVAADFPWVGLVVLTSHRAPELAVAHPNLIPPNVVYLVKSRLSDTRELAEAVHQSIRGVDAGEQSRAAGEGATTAAGRITPAQAEVLRMLAKGATTKTLADARGTTVRAVEAMLNRLYEKLGIDSTGDVNQRVIAIAMWQRGEIDVQR